MSGRSTGTGSFEKLVSFASRRLVEVPLKYVERFNRQRGRSSKSVEAKDQKVQIGLIKLPPNNLLTYQLDIDSNWFDPWPLS